MQEEKVSGMFVLFHVPSFHGTNAGTLGQADVYLLPGGGGGGGGTSCMYLKNTMLLLVTQTKTFSPKCPAL